MFLRTRWLAPMLALALAACGEKPAEPQSLVVYTSRGDDLIRPVFDLYSAETGVKIEYTSDSDAALITRLEAEGASSPADLLITVDAGNLWLATEKGLLQPVTSGALEQRVPESLQDPDNHWFGLTIRARTLVYSTERVDPATLSSYEALADPAWQGRLCLRTSKKVYNQSLVATMIERLGEEKTEEIVTGWVGNLATDVFANDTSLMEAIVAGQCDVGIVNTYYFGRLKAQQPEAPIALFWANQDSSGVHVNISGVGMTKHAKNPDAAQAFMEWLVTEPAQRFLADGNKEFPVNPTIAPSAEVAAWGEFRADDLNVAVAGKRQADAVMLMDRAGYR
jgi:iron(III) transport system substrate-binding protein